MNTSNEQLPSDVNYGLYIVDKLYNHYLILQNSTVVSIEISLWLTLKSIWIFIQTNMLFVTYTNIF